MRVRRVVGVGREREWQRNCGARERDTVYSECGKRFLFEMGKREQDESVVR